MERTADPQIMIFSFDDDGSRSRNARSTPGKSGAVETNSGNSSSTSSSGSSSAWLAMCSSASSQSRYGTVAGVRIPVRVMAAARRDSICSSPAPGRPAPVCDSTRAPVSSPNRSISADLPIRRRPQISAGLLSRSHHSESAVNSLRRLTKLAMKVLYRNILIRYHTS
jgi:hypothetical protein